MSRRVGNPGAGRCRGNGFRWRRVPRGGAASLAAAHIKKLSARFAFSADLLLAWRRPMRRPPLGKANRPGEPRLGVLPCGRIALPRPAIRQAAWRHARINKLDFPPARALIGYTSSAPFLPRAADAEKTRPRLTATSYTTQPTSPRA